MDNRKMTSMPPQIDPHQLELIVSVITDEVVHYLNGTTPSCGCPTDEAEKTRKVIAAGADRISASDAVQQCEAGIAPYIDHTLLKPEATREQVIKLCEEAVRFGFASVCINPWYVSLAAEHVRSSTVKVCTVAGFPLGATLPRVKILEAEEAIKLGAQEVDMVINVGALKSGQDEVVELDIRGVVEACHRGGAICKVILETALLTTEEKVRASVACKNAGADFVKTSTGFGPGGATAEDVALMRAAVGREMGIKAAGGIRHIEDFKKMVSAGATRIGASASVRILEEACGPSPKPASADTAKQSSY
jgi:deoxyribose-phosphate aldolase